jgi:hypothetical protein
MNKKACAIVGAAVFATLALGQSREPSSVAALSFGLKGDVLGETLQDFRTGNDRVIQTSSGYPLHETKHLPQCTSDDASNELPADVEKAVETVEEIRAGVVKCIAASSMNENVNFDDEGPTVAGIRAYSTIYYFFQGRLYKIESQLPGTEYRASPRSVHHEVWKAHSERRPIWKPFRSKGYQ